MRFEKGPFEPATPHCQSLTISAKNKGLFSAHWQVLDQEIVFFNVYDGYAINNTLEDLSGLQYTQPIVKEQPKIQKKKILFSIARGSTNPLWIFDKCKLGILTVCCVCRYVWYDDEAVCRRAGQRGCVHRVSISEWNYFKRRLILLKIIYL